LCKRKHSCRMLDTRWLREVVRLQALEAGLSGSMVVMNFIFSINWISSF
jgi:hypothetical protein